MKKFVLSTLATSALATSANAALVAGDLAIIGRTNNGSPNDSFSVVTLAPISAGEIVYFTDNGWTGTGFRGVTATDGDGSENAIRIVFNNAVASGTIISTLETGNANYAWTTSGIIGDGASGTYQHIAQGQGGEQLYAFQTTEINDPYFVTSSMTHLFVFDDTGAFENSTSSSTGNITPGLSVAAGTVAGINATVGGAVGFDTTLLTSGTKSDWLTAIANPSNWTLTSEPTGSISVIPEPTTLCTAGMAALVGLRRSRRRN